MYILKLLISEKSIGENHQPVEVLLCDDSEKDNNIESSKDLEVKRLRSQIFAEMAAIDPERAMTSMKAWDKYVQLATSRSRSIPFATLEEYLPYRIIDAGEM